jgi:histidine kinase/DNA gyrase B/HSP90-like ATPase
MVTMGAPRARAVPDPVTKSGSAAAVLDFAVGQILRDDTALGALPAVLERLVSTFGLRAAVALQLAAQPATGAAGQPPERPTVLARYPRGSVDEALLARIGTLTTGSPGVLLARSVPVGGPCLGALALIGDSDMRRWDDDVRATAHAVAAIVATQIRHTNDIAGLERSHAARPTRAAPGTGLGLSIVKVLTEMHGGRVEVKSTLGQGSTFSVYLPGTS